MKIIFMGSADFGIPTLKKLNEYHELIAVVSTPPKPQGRGLKLQDSPVTQFAKSSGIEPVITPDNLKDPSFQKTLADLGADLFVVVAFKILPKTIFSIPPLGTINIHASLLPKYRGPAPIHRAIEAGDRETGVTIFRIDEGIDTGEVLAQERVSIGPQETTPELYSRLSELGASCLIETLNKLESGSVHPLVQDNLLACRAPKLTKEEAKINWELGAQEIYNKIRAFKPFPGTYTISQGKRLGILQAESLGDAIHSETGNILKITTDYFDVSCGRGVLRVLQVKPEGKKEMSVHDFLLGTDLLKPGYHLG